MLNKLLLLSLCLTTSHSQPVSADASDESETVSHKFETLDKFLKHQFDLSPPYPSDNGPIEVSIYTELTSLLNVDQERETVEVKQYRQMSWIDHRLRWKPDEFAGIVSTRAYLKEVWVPDVLSIDKNFDMQLIPNDTNLVYIRPDGRVTVSYAERVEMQCNFDMKDFPFDVQTCSIAYSPWTHNSKQIHLVITKPMLKEVCAKASNSAFNIVGCWAKVEQRSYEIMEPGVPYDWYVRYIQIDRKPFFYIWTQVIPTGIITCLAIVGLFSPSSYDRNRTEKVTLGLTALLTIVVMLLAVSETFPRSFDKFPSLGRFYLFEMFYCSMCTVLASIVMRAHVWCNRNGKRPLCNWLLPNWKLDAKRSLAFEMRQKDRKKALINATFTSTVTISEIGRQLSEMQAFLDYMSAERKLEADIKWDFDTIDLCLLVVLLFGNFVVVMVYAFSK